MEAQETLLIETDKLRYPIGRFEFGLQYTAEDMLQFIKKIEEFPAQLKKVATGLTEEQLDDTYREGGWNVRQIIHHVADSHMNAYIRFKLTLTEDTPAIKPYDEKAWAKLEDAKTALTSISIELLTALHKRWTILLKSMTPEQFELRFYHPEHQMTHSLTQILALYAWHCDHHTAHVQLVKDKYPAAKPKSRKVNATVKPVKKQSAKKSVKG